MKNMEKILSDKQQSILKFIQDFIIKRCYPPTIRDIKNGCGISSTSVVNYNLNILSSRGLIRRTKDVSRGIEIAGDVVSSALTDNGLVSVPVLGTIAAGMPILIPQALTLSQAEEYVRVPKEMLGHCHNTYALVVKGTSMIEAFINDGDTVILEAISHVANGQVAACWLKDEQEITLKKFYADGAKVRLVAQNPQFTPIITLAANVEIQGRLLAVLRSVD
jgi:repressor LexA